MEGGALRDYPKNGCVTNIAARLTTLMTKACFTELSKTSRGPESYIKIYIRIFTHTCACSPLTL